MDYDPQVETCYSREALHLAAWLSPQRHPLCDPGKSLTLSEPRKGKETRKLVCTQHRTVLYIYLEADI